MTNHPAIKRLEDDLAIAEQALLEAGRVMASFVIMTPRKRLIVAMPAENPREKAIYYALLRLLCYAENAFAVTQIAECWMRFEGIRNQETVEELAERAKKIRPSQAPDHLEVIIAATCYRGKDRKISIALGAREIIRDTDGQPTGTKPPPFPEDSLPYDAALTQLLPPALFSEEQQQAARRELIIAQATAGIFLRPTEIPVASGAPE